jgi:ferric-dicitrate binding protein FerR (iron transport regulator)
MSTSDNIEQDYILLINSYLLGQATSEEKQTLLEWLKKSDDNKKLFDQQRKLFALSALSGSDGKFSQRKSEAWERLDASVSATSPEPKTRKLAYYFGVAASVIVIFSLGVLMSMWFSKSKPISDLSKIEHEIIVPKGGQSELVLPDGTRVWLNAGSRFRYKGDYGMDNRNVYLEGEGYFSVIKNPEKPFIVQASGLKIKAFGTSFNVKAYPDEKVVTTTLVEGVVKIEGKGVDISLKPKDVVMLQKTTSIAKNSVEVEEPENKTGNQIQSQEEVVQNFNKDVQLESNVNTDIYTSWKDNQWIIDSQSLEDIVVILERKFNVNISIASPELNKYKFTGTFNKETLEQILKVIQLTAPLNYKIDKGVVTITEEQKRKATYNNL